MAFNSMQIDELNLLMRFPTESQHQGLKIHHDAAPEVVEAATRLFHKGIISQIDGGYLTDLGQDIRQHAEHLHGALNEGA